MGRRLLGLACATALVMVAVVVPATTAPASNCYTYEFIAARGSGQAGDYTNNDPATSTLGMGGELKKTFDEVQQALAGTSVSIHGVGLQYPAVGVFGTTAQDLNGAAAALHIDAAYQESVKAGSATLKTYMATRHAQCPDMQFVVGGYSQGAHAVGDGVQAMDPDLAVTIAASVYFGDPRFNAKDAAADLSTFDPAHNGAFGPRPIWVQSPVFSYCHKADPICNLSVEQRLPYDMALYWRDLYWVWKTTHDAGQGMFANHTNYIDAGDVDLAAKRIADVLRPAAPATTPTVSSAPADVVFAIDTTGSMGSHIQAAVDNAATIAGKIANTSTSARFALVQYKDGADQGDPFRAQLVTPFTSDVASLGTGLQSLVASGGGDYPESVYSGIMLALDQPWRAGVRKSVIVMGDAPPKDPEPETGYTLQTVIDKAFSVDPAQVYTVDPVNDPDVNAAFKAISAGTGGILLTSTSGDVATELEAAVTAAGSAPTAMVVAADGTTGEPAALSAAGTVFDPADPVIGYDWNFGTGTPLGSYDQTTTTALTSHTYAKAGTYTVSLRARTKSGLSGLATATITVSAPATKPAAPTGLVGKPGDGQVQLTWQPTHGAVYYSVLDGTGKAVESFSPIDPAHPTWTGTGLVNETPLTYSVVAVNNAGYSPPSAAVTVTPQAPTTGTPEPTPSRSPSTSSGTPAPVPTSSVTPVAATTPAPTLSPSATPVPTVTLSASQVRAGGTLTLTAAGLPAGARVQVWLHSTPTLLNTWTADGLGTATGAVTIPANTVPGPHTLEARVGGLTASAPVTVIAASSAPLAHTGATILPLVALALLLLALGAVVVVVAYTRRSRPARH